MKHTVLIRSNETDFSTIQIIDYLIREQTDFIKLNQSDRVLGFELKISESFSKVVLYFDFGTVDSESIGSYFYRRGLFEYSHDSFETVDLPLRNSVLQYQADELKFSDISINHILDQVPIRIGGILKAFTPKIKQLMAAKSARLAIPDTIVCSTKPELQNFLSRHQRIITKGIQANFSHTADERKEYLYMFTSEVKPDDLKNIPGTFFPTLFQQCIEKKYELRIFYLHGKCYAMAIFSQFYDETMIDFRNYSDDQPVRMVPFQLPENLIEKIHNFMAILDLNTGSLDMIVNEKGDYVFLEVNPDGQFGMVSIPCNYFIEREIANILSRANGF